MERAGAEIARVDRVGGLLVQLDAHEAFGFGAGVEISAERQRVGRADGDDQVLVHTGRVHRGAGIDGALLVEFVGEGGVVAWGMEGMCGVGHIGCDPRGKTTFEAAVDDDVV